MLLEQWCKVHGAIAMKHGERCNWSNGARSNCNETRCKVQLKQWCKVQLKRNKVQGAIGAIVQGAQCNCNETWCKVQLRKKQGARCYWSNRARCTVQLLAMKHGARCNWINGARCNWNQTRCKVQLEQWRKRTS